MNIREKILIVEDEKSIAHFISTILNSNDYETLLARSGSEAKTMIDLLVRRNRKRTGFLVVKGTQTEIVRAALFQLHILRNDLYNVVPRGQLVQKYTVKRHFVSLLPYLSNENEYMIPIFVNPQSYSSFLE